MNRSESSEGTVETMLQDDEMYEEYEYPDINANPEFRMEVIFEAAIRPGEGTTVKPDDASALKIANYEKDPSEIPNYIVNFPVANVRSGFGNSTRSYLDTRNIAILPWFTYPPDLPRAVLNYYGTLSAQVTTLRSPVTTDEKFLLDIAFKSNVDAHARQRRGEYFPLDAVYRLSREIYHMCPVIVLSNGVLPQNLPREYVVYSKFNGHNDGHLLCVRRERSAVNRYIEGLLDNFDRNSNIRGWDVHCMDLPRN